jgi:hypothetical protein
MKRLLVTSTLLFLASPVAAQDIPTTAEGSYLTFINVLWVFVGLILAVAVFGLFGKYVLPLIENLPPSVLEGGAYVVAFAGAFVAPNYFGPVASFIAALISIPIFAAAITYRLLDTSWRLILAACTVFIAAAAFLHVSAFFGAISVLCLLWLCGSCFMPLVEGFEVFSDRHYVPSAFWASFLLLGVSTHLGLTSNPEWLAVFKPGIYWVAGTIYAAGLLTLSCRYYYAESQSWPNWAFWQVMAVTSGIGALYLGHVYGAQLDSTVLQEIGGTFLAVYLIEKLCELPWSLKHWPWLALAVGVGGYFAVKFAAARPDYFLAF